MGSPPSPEQLATRSLHHSQNMDSKIVIPAGIFLLLCLIDTGSSIKCHQCNSYEDALCADPFFHDEEAEKPPMERIPKNPDFLQECPADTADKKYFCRKIAQTVRGDDRIIRSCGWVEDDRGRECYTTVLEEYNTLVCKCDTEGCNGATGFSVSLLATLSAVVLAYLIH